MKNRRMLLIAAAVTVLAVGYFSCRAWNRQQALKTNIGEVTTYDGPAPAVAAAEDWPRWLGPRGDGISRETNLAERWPDGGPRKLWSASVGVGYSSPVAAGGRVYLFSLDNKQEALTAFDAHSGRIAWNQKAATGWTDDYPGTRATPTIDGDSIYTYGGAGDLTRRDLKTGNARWQVNVLNLTGAKNLQWGMASSPLVAGGRVYVQSGPGGPVAVAVDAGSGQIVWQSEARGSGGYAAPVLVDVSGTPQLVVFGGEAVYGMDPAGGRTLWSEPWATSYKVNAATPAYRDGHLFVSSEYGMGSMMLRLSPGGGAQKLWSNKQVQSKFQPVILDGGFLYAATDRRIKCLSWPDGRVKWRTEEGEPPVGDNGSIVRAGDKLIALSDGGTVSLVRAMPDGAAVLGQFEAVKGDKVWSVPLLYAGRLYVKGPKELVCFDVSASAPTTVPATAPAGEGAADKSAG